MTINNYKEVLNISSSVWMAKGVTGIEFKEKLITEKDIDPFIVQEKYNAMPIGSTLTHSAVGYQISLMYHKNILHGCFLMEMISADRIQEYVNGKISEYQLIGVENICNLYQEFVQTLLAAGVELKINNYANTAERTRNLGLQLDILQERRIGDAREYSHPEVTTDNTDLA